MSKFQSHNYFGARYYDSEVSVWLSVDPSALSYPSWSPYSYVYDNPIMYVDPDGKDPREGNEVLTINFGRCYITKIGNDDPTFYTADGPLERRARSFQDWGIGPGFSPLIKAPRILQKMYDAVQHYGNAKEIIEGIIGATPNEHLRAWQEAAKSDEGYEYIEFDIKNNKSTHRRVIDAGHINGLDVDGYENFVSEKNVYQEGKLIESTFYSLHETKDSDGNKYMEIRKATYTYEYNADGTYDVNHSVSYEKAEPDKKDPGTWDTTQPGEIE